MTYEDLCDLIRCGGGISKPYCLSGNNFVTEPGEKSTEQIEQKIAISKRIQESFSLLDLRNCKFSQEKKELLRKKIAIYESLAVIKFIDYNNLFLQNNEINYFMKCFYLMIIILIINF